MRLPVTSNILIASIYLTPYLDLIQIAVSIISGVRDLSLSILIISLTLSVSMPGVVSIDTTYPSAPFGFLASGILTLSPTLISSGAK